MYIANYNIEMIKFCKSLGMKIDGEIIENSFQKMQFKNMEIWDFLYDEKDFRTVLEYLKKEIEETDTVDFIFTHILNICNVDRKKIRYYYSHTYQDIIRVFDYSKIKLTKKILIEAIDIGRTSVDITDYNIEIDDDFKKVCHKRNFYPYDMDYTDEDVLLILKNDNNKAIENINKKKFKYKSEHLRQCYVSCNSFKTYNNIIKTYTPTREDFEYCFNSLDSLKMMKVKMLRDIYNKIKD
ncbi:MAG: hypothetical protein CMF62_03080 [Magnetococcales bacterium]|nr:hypothetical protein [Magnetococcales bacterium]